MRNEYLFTWHLVWCYLLFLSVDVYFKDIYTSGEIEYTYSKGCAYLPCENGSRCIKQRFWCKNPPCPGMLYCSTSRKEAFKGPSTCDTVRCSGGHVCVVKVRECRWNENCKQQIARCISEKEYYEGAASCAGVECPSGEHCILRESYCSKPPCKLLRSCAKMTDVRVWFEKCRNLNCPSEYECFLRKPADNCQDSFCIHTPDCTFTTDDKLIIEHCHGWICPLSQKCIVRIVGSCKGFDCTVERSCRGSSNVSTMLTVKYDRSTSEKVTEESLIRKNPTQIENDLIFHNTEKGEMDMQITTSYPITSPEEPLLISMLKQGQDPRHTIIKKHRTGVSVIHQQTTTKKSPLITEPLGSSSNKIYSTLPYPASQFNHNGVLTTNTIKNDLKIMGQGDVSEITFPDPLKNSNFPTNMLTGRKIESNVPYDTERLKALRKIYVAAIDDTLPFPILLKVINIAGQDYPIWITNDLRRTTSLESKGLNNEKWRFTELQEPYRILLPPYEPAVLIEGQRYSPLFPHTFDRTSEEVLIPSPSKGNNSNNHINDSTTIEMEAFTAIQDKISNRQNFDQSFNNDENFSTIEKMHVIPLNSHQSKELYDYPDNYKWQPWYMIYDYPMQQESAAHEERIESIIEYIADDLYNDYDIEMPAGAESTNKKDRHVTETTLYMNRHNEDVVKSLDSETLSSTGQSDYQYEEYDDFIDYPYDTIPIYRDDKLKRQYRRSLERKMLKIPSNANGNP